ncbi:MAG: hypothetical protein AAAB21_20505 [Pseudomonas chlororaphis]
MDTLGWTDLENGPEGDWLLNTMQYSRLQKLLAKLAGPMW